MEGSLLRGLLTRVPIVYAHMSSAGCGGVVARALRQRWLRQLEPCRCAPDGTPHDVLLVHFRNQATARAFAVAFDLRSVPGLERKTIYRVRGSMSGLHHVSRERLAARAQLEQLQRCRAELVYTRSAVAATLVQARGTLSRSAKQLVDGGS